MTWNELPNGIQNALLAYYEAKYQVEGLTAVKAAITQDCFEKAITDVLNEVTLRIRRLKVDVANRYEPTDPETIDYINLKIVPQ